MVCAQSLRSVKETRVYTFIHCCFQRLVWFTYPLPFTPPPPPPMSMYMVKYGVTAEDDEEGETKLSLCPPPPLEKAIGGSERKENICSGSTYAGLYIYFFLNGQKHLRKKLQTAACPYYQRNGNQASMLLRYARFSNDTDKL